MLKVRTCEYVFVFSWIEYQIWSILRLTLLKKSRNAPQANNVTIIHPVEEYSFRFMMC